MFRFLYDWLPIICFALYAPDVNPWRYVLSACCMLIKCWSSLRVDYERIKAVGPDRAAAEWLLRCGAKVRFQGFDRWHHDYNGLPTGPLGRYKIQAIDATESCIMYRGFDHLGQCYSVENVMLLSLSGLTQSHYLFPPNSCTYSNCKIKQALSEDRVLFTSSVYSFRKAELLYVYFLKPTKIVKIFFYSSSA